jgi:demethylmenaquinone methyltransferase/2-methoxy-6-polyprenyl-1,4-benzoquinol methylase
MRTAESSESSPDGLLTGEEKRQAVRQMFDAIAPSYDAMNKAMTFGLDSYWRRRAVALLGLEPPAKVLDLACGTGDFCRLASARHLEVVGLDYSAGMLRSARAGGVPLCQGDAAALPFQSGAFQGIVSGFALRNLADLAGSLGEMARILRPGGRVSLLEVAEPSLPGLRQAHGIWFNKVVPRLGALSPEPAAYDYLPRSVAYLPPGGELLEMMERAGLKETRRHLLTGGVVQVLTAVRL